MNKLFSFTVPIQGTDQGQTNTLMCKITAEIDGCSSKAVKELETFLQQLFKLVAKHQAKDEFTIVGEDKTCFDDLELQIFNEEIKLSDIVSINRDNAEVFFSDDVWLPSNLLIEESILAAFIAHIECLKVLEKRLEDTENVEKEEVFEEISEKLCELCYGYIETNNRLIQQLNNIGNEMDENDLDFQRELQEYMQA